MSFLSNACLSIEHSSFYKLNRVPLDIITKKLNWGHLACVRSYERRAGVRPHSIRASNEKLGRFKMWSADAPMKVTLLANYAPHSIKGLKHWWDTSLKPSAFIADLENKELENGKKIRWGILATGWIADLFLNDLLLTGHSVTAVGSRIEKTANRFAKEFDIAAAHGSYEALVADPNVDVVYIATPHPHHVSAAILALDAGKHVLIEKPFTINAREAAKHLFFQRWDKRAKVQQARSINTVLNAKHKYGFWPWKTCAEWKFLQHSNNKKAPVNKGFFVA